MFSLRLTLLVLNYSNSNNSIWECSNLKNECLNFVNKTSIKNFNQLNLWNMILL